MRKKRLNRRETDGRVRSTAGRLTPFDADATIKPKNSRRKEAYKMKKTLGTMIAELRKQHGMTQLELAEKMNVTDKAVSKWERDLSCPDINSLPKLAEILGVSVDELMQIKKEAAEPVSKVQEIMDVAPKAVAMAMGIAVAALTVLNELDIKSAMVMLGIGLACAGIALMNGKKE